MRNYISLIMLCGFLASPAFAQETSQLNAEGTNAVSGGSPKPIDPVLHYSDLKGIWQNKASMSPTIMTFSGSWKTVAHATTIHCAPTHGPDKTDSTGLANRDGSIRHILFGDFPTSTPNKMLFGVKLENLGSKRFQQGPYQVDMTEPQFAQWGYVNGAMSYNSYYTYSCRITSADNNHMVCAMALHLGRGNWDYPSIDCSRDQFGMMEEFVRE